MYKEHQIKIQEDFSNINLPSLSISPKSAELNRSPQLKFSAHQEFRSDRQIEQTRSTNLCVEWKFKARNTRSISTLRLYMRASASYLCSWNRGCEICRWGRGPAATGGSSRRRVGRRRRGRTGRRRGSESIQGRLDFSLGGTSRCWYEGGGGRFGSCFVLCSLIPSCSALSINYLVV